MSGRTRTMLDIEAGVPRGLGEFLRCGHCGCLISPALWQEGPCPVCGKFADGCTTPPPPLAIIDSIGLICSGVLRGAYDPPPSARDLAEMIMDEIPSFSGRG